MIGRRRGPRHDPRRAQPPRADAVPDPSHGGSPVEEVGFWHREELTPASRPSCSTATRAKRAGVGSARPRGTRTGSMRRGSARPRRSSSRAAGRRGSRRSPTRLSRSSGRAGEQASAKLAWHAAHDLGCARRRHETTRGKGNKEGATRMYAWRGGTRIAAAPRAQCRCSARSSSSTARLCSVSWPDARHAWPRSRRRRQRLSIYWGRLGSLSDGIVDPL